MAEISQIDKEDGISANCGSGKFAAILKAARGGESEKLGELLEACRRYLALVAANGLNAELRSKCGASDLVQETFVKAKKGFEQFRGESEAEWKAWLLRILETTKANFERQFYDTDQRRIAREFIASDSRLASHASDGLSAPISSPSSHVRRDEESERLYAAIGRLPEHYRQAIELRQQWKLSFEEIGVRLDCSKEAARKIWARALVLLRKELGTE